MENRILTKFKGIDKFSHPARLADGYFVDLTNIYIKDTELRRDTGYKKLGSAMSGAVLLIDEFFTKADDDYLLAITEDYAYYLNAGVWTSIGSVSGSVDEGISSDIWSPDDYYIFTSHTSGIKKINESLVLSDLTTNFTAASLCVYDNRVFYFNIVEGANEYPQKIIWSADGTCDDFTGTGSGNLYLVDTPGYIIGAFKLLDNIIVYKERSIYTLRPAFSGGYEYIPVVLDVGPFSQWLISSLGTSHIFMGSDGFYVFDGSPNLTEVMLEVRDYLLGPNGVVNRDYLNRAFCFYVEELGEVWFVLPKGSSEYPNFVVRYNTETEAVSFRELPVSLTNYGFYSKTSSVTWAGITGTWADYVGISWDALSAKAKAPTNLLGAQTGQVYEYDYLTFDDDGTDITGRIETGDFGLPDQRIRLLKVRLYGSGTDIDVRYSTDSGGSWTLAKSLTLESENKVYTIFLNKSCKHVRFELKSSNAFSIAWMELVYEPEGYIS